jgi:hypothetical protein
VAASYNGRTGLAKIFLNGIKQAETMFPESGDFGSGTDFSTEINYDYAFDVRPWWSTGASAALCARVNHSSAAVLCITPLRLVCVRECQYVYFSITWTRALHTLHVCVRALLSLFYKCEI